MSTDFPTTPGAFQTTKPGVDDAFVTKLNAAGSALLYSTFLGGSNGGSGTAGIAVDAAGNAYVTGVTLSSDFPTTPGAFQPTPGPFQTNPQVAFVAQLNAAGSALVYSTYLGTTVTGGNGIAVDAAGHAYVTGVTGFDFPTTPGAFQTTLAPFEFNPQVAFVTQLNAAGSALVYSTYLGVSIIRGHAIAVDAAGHAYVTGHTSAPDFPTTPRAFQTTCRGCDPESDLGDAFITKLNAAGSALLYSSYLGGNDIDNGTGIGVDAAANAYVTGYSFSSNFPTIPGAFQATFGGVVDAFVAKVAAPTFAGTPGRPNCHGESVSALAQEFGGLEAAAAALGFPSVQALQDAIQEFCEE